MKTLKAFQEEHKDNAVLIKRVYKRMGQPSDAEFFSSLDQINEGGAESGVPGFIYSYDIAMFWLKNRKEIQKLYEEIEFPRRDVTDYEKLRAFFGPLAKVMENVYALILDDVLEEIASWYKH